MANDMKKNILFLQGPLGNFFKLLSSYIDSETSSNAYHITFNGGDAWFSDKRYSHAYSGKPTDWQAYLNNFIEKNSITDIVVFGDCRFYHRIAKSVAEDMNLTFWVFEEGYLRPSFITLEEGGVNGNSSLLGLDFSVLEEKHLEEISSKTSRLRSPFWDMSINAIQYYFFKQLYTKNFPHYIHHRPWYAIEEFSHWIKAGFRKLKYKGQERGIVKQLTTTLSKKYFLVPLQVSVDSQILYHSPYGSVEEFISVVIKSFSQKASKEDYLVFKHHPMDRGFNNYARYIKKLCYAYDLTGRVLYCHDAHLPTLIKEAKGLVTINSTVGISSLHHSTPTKVLGRAVYDLDGVTSQKPLDDFWKTCCKPCEVTFKKFNQFLKSENQIPGSFYQQPELVLQAVTDKFFNLNNQ